MIFLDTAPAARRAAKRGPTIIEKGTTRMHRDWNPFNSFLMVKMASGMDHRRVRPTTTTTNDVAQHDSHPANTKSCTGSPHIRLEQTTVEPRFNEAAGDRPDLFVKWRVRYIENLDITNLRGKDQNVRYIEVIVND